jgi:hypothetical protein
MKKFIETRDGWWHNSRKVILLVSLIVSALFAFLTVVLIYVFGYVIFLGFNLNIDFVLFTIMAFFISFIICFIFSFIWFSREHIVIYKGTKNYFKSVAWTIKKSLIASNIQYQCTKATRSDTYYQFKLKDPDCYLNIRNKGDEIKPYGILISILPITHKNRMRIKIIKSNIKNIMRHYNFTVFENNQDLIHYSDSF